ncbi:chromate reductase [Noviherbaspirillum humi]|uniref:Chromate reductase n=1 Tax=Noviherbaspirillum humi TaxID=1688639 RepID=A0A239ISC3_9BURK|nr:NAD(P)H-dependent oxidoreductase [Noviherbaspirillum humi]SNS96471.1 chromate reductase [Noviherbaspirillum humi]
MKIGVVVGSPRKQSFSRKLANAIGELVPAGMQMEIIPIDNLPFYNQDLEDAGESPATWLEFRDRLRACDGILFVTPEYNRGVPAMLKNAIDVGSRPYGKAAWGGKPAAVVSISQGPMGGFGANHALRQSLVFLNMPCMQQPEAYIGGVANLFDAEGKLTVDSTREFLTKFANAVAGWVQLHAAKQAA